MTKSRGIALAMTLVVILVISVVAGAIVLLGVSNQAQIGQNQQETLLLHIADGGVHEAMAAIYENPAYQSDGSGQYTTNLVNANYWWTFNNTGSGPWCVNNMNGATAVNGPSPPGGTPVQVPPGTAFIVVSASAEGVNGPAPVRVASIVTSVYPYGMASDGKILINAFRGASAPGSLRSNLVGGNPNIDIRTTLSGTAISRDGEGSITGNGGTKLFNQPPVGIPNIPIDQIVASWGSVAGPYPHGGPATYRVNSSVDFSGNPPNRIILGPPVNQTVNAPPPGQEVTIYVDGNLTLQHATLPKGVHLFVKGDLRTNGQLETVNSAPVQPHPSARIDPNSNYVFVGGSTTTNGASGPNLMLFSTGDIRYNGNTTGLSGFMYVRNGNITLNGRGTFQGIGLVRTNPGSTNGNVTARNVEVIFDPTKLPEMVTFGVNIPTPMRALSWWVWSRK